MRKYFLILLLLVSAAGFSQTTPNIIYGKEVVIQTRDTSSAEFTIKNSTRNVLGYFKNIGGGKGQYVIIPQTDITGLPDSLLARYTKAQADARFKTINYVPAWIEITDKPANFSTTHALSNDIQDSLLNKVSRDGSYANPSWITSLDYSKLTGTVPTWNQNTTGNAATVTNGVYTTGSYANPSWITSLDYSKLTGTVPTWNQNTTGNAATVTNGVYSTGSYANPSWISEIAWSKVSGAPSFITGINSSMVTAALGYTPENLANKGVANGYADLDATGKIPASRIDFGQTGQTFVVSSQAAMLAVSGANVGALAVRTDENKNYRLIAQPASTLGNWQVLLSPDAPVQSVNGFTGNVNLLTTHISEGSNYWWTAARSRAAQSLTTSGSNGAATYDNTTGVLNIPTYTLSGLGGQPALSGTGFVKISGTTISYDNSTYLTSFTETDPTIYSWAKAASKPSYSWGEITGTVPTWNQNTTGNAATSSFLLSQGSSLTSQVGASGSVYYNHAITYPQTGLFPASDNSNSILTFNRHPGDYYSQLGFSSNGNLYYRRYSAAAIETTLEWQTILTSASFNSYAPTLLGVGASGTWTINITGNAATVSNGVYTTGSYSNPSWITSLDYSKLTGTVPTWNQNTTGTANSLSSVLSSSLGGAGSVSGLLKANGSGVVSAALASDITSLISGTYVDLTSNQTLGGTKTFTNSIIGRGNALFQNSTTNILNIGADQQMYGGTNSDGGIFVYGNNKLHLSTNSSRHVTVDGSGNTGFGTVSPAFKVDIVGTLGVSGVTNISNSLTATGLSSLGTSQTTDLLFIGDRTTVGTKYLKFSRPSAVTDDVEINAINGGVGGTTLKFQTTGSASSFGGTITATSFIKSGGTSSQFLKADGSIDGSTYLTSYSETDPTIYSWAKAASKPTYSWGEITGTVPTWNQNTSGNAATSSFLLSQGSSLTSQVGAAGSVYYNYAIVNPQTGLFPASDNANSILTLNRHPGDYYSQLGFSSNGNLYYRMFAAAAINTSQSWVTLLSSQNYNSYTPTLTGGGASGTWGINITGNAATVTNGVYTTGDQYEIGGNKSFLGAVEVLSIKTTGGPGTPGVIKFGTKTNDTVFTGGSSYVLPVNIDGTTYYIRLWAGVN